ncbi:MAG: tetratricopeptide repeat protein [Candidatus Brocadiales bacterium]
MSNWGDFLLKLGRYDEAEGAYRRAIEVKETWRSYLGLAKVYVALGEKGREDWMYEEALAHLNTVIDLYPDIGKHKESSKDYYFQRGYVHAKLGHWREAERDFRQCGGDPKAERNIRRIRDRVKGEVRPPKTLLWGGRVMAGISTGWLIFVCVWYFCRLDLRLLKMAPIDAELLKVLVPIFLFFTVVGISLPYIRAIKGPAGIGFEKEITIRPEAVASAVPLESQG